MANRKGHAINPVDAYIDLLSPELRSDVQALRELVMNSGEGMGEEIKWNAPSFFYGEHFATMRLGGKVRLSLILHLGAKKSAISPGSIEDPSSILRWLGPDRACVDFDRPGSVEVKRGPLESILRQWVKQMPRS